jgi:hypothetical protein
MMSGEMRPNPCTEWWPGDGGWIASHGRAAIGELIR